MTKIEITIQNGKITCFEQRGEEIPNPKWDELVATITNFWEGFEQ